MKRAREPCSNHCGALRRWARRKSTSRQRNQAHAPQSAAAARTLRLRATSLSLLSEKVSHASSLTQKTRYAVWAAWPLSGRVRRGDPEQHRHSTPQAGVKRRYRRPFEVFRTRLQPPALVLPSSHLAEASGIAVILDATEIPHAD